ncbi:apolipoprotein N-acyltransferase [Sphingomonas sp. 1P06PA]|uniref:apolipoprotein N-acyltransferase n=1 Tax=Sphingomonas sp. 1P06PA TaxID=554121 RepID=UPI0039A502D2
MPASLHLRWMLALIAGALAATGFAPWGLLPVALAALAGWLLLVRAAPTLRHALAIGWWFGLGHFTIGLNWIATAFTYQAAMPAWLGWLSVLLLSLYLAVYPALAAGLAWRLGRDRPIAFAAVAGAGWIATEWLRATMFTGFAWNPLSAMLAAWIGAPVIAGGLFAIVGSYAISGLLLFAVGLTIAAAEPRRRWPALALAALVLVALATTSWTVPAATGPRIRIVQPNIGQQDKWKPGFEARNTQLLVNLSRRTSDEPRLLLWPEAAVTDYLEEEPRARRKIASLLGPRDLLLTGGVALVFDGGKVVAARNSLFALDPAGRLRGRYDKAHLVPYGEYLPARPILSALGLSRLAPGDLDFLPGPGPRTLALPGFGRAGSQICYEIIFSGHVVDRGDRPDFLFNPSNDAWFGAWGPPQHLAQARLRAAEEGMPVLRSTPTGISAVIDGAGHVTAHLPWRVAAVIDARLPAALQPTPFARGGNAIAFLVAAMLAVLAIASHRAAR